MASSLAPPATGSDSGPTIRVDHRVDSLRGNGSPTSMRGPGYKLSLDVRRVWRCPACGYERKASGQLTSLRCRCPAAPFMQLAGEPRFQRLQNRPLNPYVSADEILGPAETTAVVEAATAPDPVATDTEESAPALREDSNLGIAAGVMSEDAPPLVTTTDTASSLTAPTGAASDAPASRRESPPSQRTRNRRPGRGPRGPKPAS